MTPEEWQRAKPILDSALQLDSSSCPAFLKQACADPALRHEIESLIAANEQAGPDALESIPVRSGASGQIDRLMEPQARADLSR